MPRRRSGRKETKADDSDRANDSSVLAADLRAAARKGDLDALVCCLDRASSLGIDIVDRPDSHGNTALSHACVAGKTDAAAHLIQRGANVNAEEGHKWRPLHFAAQKNHVEIVQLLLRNGADVDALNKDLWRPIHFACVEGGFAVVAALLGNGAEFQPRNRELWTPLHFAAQKNCGDIVRLLLHRGADANAENVDKWKPIHFAAWEGAGEAFDVLLAAGADLTSRNKDSFLPIHLAASRGQMALLRKIVALTSSQSTPDAAVEIALESGMTCTAIGLRNQHLDVTRFFTHHLGARLDVRIADGQSAVYCAVTTPMSSAALLDAIDVVLGCGRESAEVATMAPNEFTPLLRLTDRRDEVDAAPVGCMRLLQHTSLVLSWVEL